MSKALINIEKLIIHGIAITSLDEDQVSPRKENTTASEDGEKVEDSKEQLFKTSRSEEGFPPEMPDILIHLLKGLGPKGAKPIVTGPIDLRSMCRHEIKLIGVRSTLEAIKNNYDAIVLIKAIVTGNDDELSSKLEKSKKGEEGGFVTKEGIELAKAWQESGVESRK